MYNRAKIIAEPAIYWHGDRHLFKKTMKAAAACDCDMFKIQWFNTKNMGNPWKAKAPFYKRCEYSTEDVVEIDEMCKQENMTLVITANHPFIMDKMQEVGLRNVKIASGQIEPLMFQKLAQYDSWERIFISTGMLDDVEKLDMIKMLDGKAKEIIVMHCVSLYPHDDSETNLNRMNSLMVELNMMGFTGLKRGYSDHARDDMATLVAMAMGAEYVERHFKLPESYGPTSNIASLPDEMRKLSYYRDRVTMIQGNGKIAMQERETLNLDKYKTRWMLV